MTKPRTTAFILRGPSFGTVLANLIGFLSRLPADKAWQVEVKPYRKARTDAQNAALWKLAYGPLMDFMGLSGDDERKALHRDMCGDYFGWTETPLGTRVPVRTTTRDEKGQPTKLTTLEFSEFYGWLQRRAAEYGVYISDPDPFWKEQG